MIQAIRPCMAFFRASATSTRRIPHLWPSPARSSTETCRRHFASSKADVQVKASVALLSRLRKETQVSITKGREALVATGNNFEEALAWLTEDAVKSGTKKAAKLEGRVAAEGVVTVVVTGGENGWGDKLSLLELCCETDFVSRSEIFRAFAGRIATAGLLLQRDAPSSIKRVISKEVLSAPLLPPASVHAVDSGAIMTVKEGIMDVIGKLGENINVRRFVVAGAGDGSKHSKENILVGSFVHNGESATFGTTFINTGRISAAVLLKIQCDANVLSEDTKKTLGSFARSVARHVVALNPKCLSETSNLSDAKNDDAASTIERSPEEILLNQSLMGGRDDETVAAALVRVGSQLSPKCTLEILDFVRFEAGEGVERAESNFAEEVRKVEGNH